MKPENKGVGAGGSSGEYRSNRWSPVSKFVCRRTLGGLAVQGASEQGVNISWASCLRADDNFAGQRISSQGSKVELSPGVALCPFPEKRFPSPSSVRGGPSGRIKGLTGQIAALRSMGWTSIESE